MQPELLECFNVDFNITDQLMILHSSDTGDNVGLQCDSADSRNSMMQLV